MRDFFRAEMLRFRSWTIAYALIHLFALVLMARVVDPAQQPDRIYQLVGLVYAITGLLLGLYQMGGYRRPGTWLNLLHRPLSSVRIALALLAAGAVLLAIAVLLPLLVIAGWQETMTARVLDARHVFLSLSALLVSLCAYLAGCYAMLANKRYAFSGLIFLIGLALADAVGMGAIALQCLALAWLLAMVLFAFKPDLSSLPGSRSAPGTALAGMVTAALPLQMTMWFVLLLAGVVVETAWIASGSHPNNLAVNPPDSVKAANYADAKTLMVMGLQASTAAEAAVWREQAGVAEVFDIGPNAAELPVRNSLMNVASIGLDDEQRRIRWEFSHDSLKFEGMRVADSRAAGSLGIDGNRAFPAPPLPGPEGMLLTAHTIYQYDRLANVILPRVQAPAGETITGGDRIGDRVAVLTDRALYFFDARDFRNDTGLVSPRQRMPLPGKTGNLTRIVLMPLVDGSLVSFLFSAHQHNAEGAPAYQLTQRIDEAGRIQDIARRMPQVPYGPGWRYQNWYPSPLLYGAKNAVLDLFSGYVPIQDDKNLAPVPRSMQFLAAGLMCLSLLAAIWRTRRAVLSRGARALWLLACAALSVPALMSLWLMVPLRERAPC